MRNKGITLIALVITIIVLIILAGVSISLVLGENGIIQKAKLSKTETEKASAKERIEMEVIGSYNDEGNLLASDVVNNIKKNIPEASIEQEEFPLKVRLEKYVFMIDKDGNIEYLRPVALVKNRKIEQEDGTVIPEGGVEDGTKLKIEFDVTIDGGTIQKVTPGTLENGKVTYITEGTEEKVDFEIVSIVDGETNNQTETIELESYYKKLAIGEAVKVGDYVNYSLGSWTQSDIEKLGNLYSGPSADVELRKFGGFGVEGSASITKKDEGLVCKGYGGSIPMNGWRVLEICEDKSIKIVHAGTSELFYGPGTGKETDIYLLKYRDWSMYEDCSSDSVNTSYAVKGSAHCLSTEEIGKISDTSGLRLISTYYWLSGSSNNNGGIACGSSGRD